MRVTRGSERSLKMPSSSFSDASAARCASAPSTMLRNLIIWNWPTVAPDASLAEEHRARRSRA